MITKWGGLGLVALACLTFHRAAIWGDERQLWTEAAQRSPEKPRPLINLARCEYLDGEYALADQHFQHAVGLADARPAREATIAREVAGVNRVLTKMALGDHDGARLIAVRTLAAYPAFRPAWQACRATTCQEE